MNTKNNQRARITKLIFHQAYLSLLSEVPNEKITVRALCEKAELNRSTFYLHYQEPNDILIEIEDEQLEKTENFLAKISINTDGKSYMESYEYNYQFLNYVHTNAEIFSVLLLKNKDRHFKQKFQATTFKTIMESFDIPDGMEHAELAYKYIVAGSMTLIEHWIMNGFQESEETLCDLLFSMARGCLVGVIGMLPN